MDLIQANPLIVTADDFATPDECAALIDAAKGRLSRATLTSDGVDTDINDMRTNSHALLGPRESPHVMALALRVSVLVRLPLSHAEYPTALHYLPGQEFKPHSDGYRLNRIEGLDDYGGQRLFTSILFLNAPEGGGATGFPNLELKVAPAPGRLLIFANTLAGARDATKLAVHAGEPVTAGEKWALTIWWRERPMLKGRRMMQ